MSPACGDGVPDETSRTEIPKEHYLPPVDAPIFFGATKFDYICPPSAGKRVFALDGFKERDVTTVEFETDHWAFLAKPDEVNRALGEWIEKVIRARAA